MPYRRLRAVVERPEPSPRSAQGSVLQALLWRFHNSRSGCCFPSYEAIADRAGCARSTVAEALKVLELAGVMTWQHRIARARVRQRDLFGRWSNRWTVIRTSNAYVFRDPKASAAGLPRAQSENPAGTKDQEVISSVLIPACNPDAAIERALAQLGAALAARKGIEQGAGRAVSAS